MAKPPKRLRAWFAIAEQEGWTYDVTADGHPRFLPPAGLMDPVRQRLAAPVTFGKTPSDHRGDANQVALLRRLGVPIPHKGHTKRKDQR